MNRTASYIRQIQQFGTDASFVANLIMTRHAKPATKLRNVLYLLNTGRDVRTRQFDDTLLIDGHAISFNVLDNLDATLDIVNPRL